MAGPLTLTMKEQVSAGGTGHAESIQIVYDPSKIAYTRLLDGLLAQRRPAHGRGAVLRSRPPVPERDRLAKRFGRALATEVVAASDFYPAEEYHQRYHEKKPVRYRLYRWNCGRDARLKEVWGGEAPAAEPAP